MEILIRILIAFEVIICVPLIGVVLIQRSKGQGVGLSFGGGAEAVFGSQVGNILTKATVVLGVLFLVNTTVIAVLSKHRASGSGGVRSVTDSVPTQTVTAPAMSAEDTMDTEAALQMLDVETAAPADVAPEAPIAIDIPAPEAPVEGAGVAESPAEPVAVPAESAPAVEAPAPAPVAE